MIELYFVYDGNENHEPKLTDREHLNQCIEAYRELFQSEAVYVSHAVMCFSGYFVKGEYVGKY